MSGPKMDSKREIWLLWETDTILQNVHPKAWCSKRCAIHNPSQNVLSQYPLGFDPETKALYRTCQHGVKHWDADEAWYWNEQKLKALHDAGSPRAASRDPKFQFAMERIERWACPDCGCECCSATSVILKRLAEK